VCQLLRFMRCSRVEMYACLGSRYGYAPRVHASIAAATRFEAVYRRLSSLRRRELAV
jgi:hypothetical protein